MPTVWESGPYRFFSTLLMGTNNHIYTLNVKETKQNSGLTQLGYKTAAATAAMNLIVFKGSLKKIRMDF